MQKVLIIGAGPAGLTAGLEILKNSKDYQVTILEESGEIGGISRTVKYKGNRMDIGGHRFFSKDKRVNEWWEKLMPLQGAPSYDDKVLNRILEINEKGPDPEIVDKVMLIRTRVSRIYYNKKFFDYPVKLNWNTIKNMGVVTTLISGFSYMYSILFKLPENSLEGFYINRFGRKLYSMFFESYTEKLWGRHPRDISADWGAQRVKGLSIIAILKDIAHKILPENMKQKQGIETSLIEKFTYPKFGPGQLWETAAEEICKYGGTICKNSRVMQVHMENGKAVGVTYTKNGETITENADYILSSMPLKDLIIAMNDIPENIEKIAKGLPYRDFVTVGLLVKKINLKNETKFKTLKNIVPDCWIYVQDAGVKLGRIQIFNNWSPYMVEKPEETVWIGLEYFCQEGDNHWKMSEREWNNFGVEELLNMGVLSHAEEVLDYHVEKVKKAYPAYFDTYNKIDQLISYLDQFGNLYCIGRNGQHRYNNMDHSMVTAFEAVKNILTGAADHSNVWNVNTDQEYHEESGRQS